jgi:hypothetical protein
MTIKNSTSNLIFLFLSLAMSLTVFQYMTSVLGQINTLIEKKKYLQYACLKAAVSGITGETGRRLLHDLIFCSVGLSIHLGQIV